MKFWVPDLDCPLAHQITFSLWKRPISWKRPEPGRTKTGQVYMRKNNNDKDHQRTILRAFTLKVGQLGIASEFPWPGPVQIQVFNYFATPRTSWWEGKQMVARPDVDNLTKQVMDALLPKGKGGWGAYLDDSQVVDLTGSKRYDGRGDIITVQMLFWHLVPKPIRRKRG